jgi:DNA-directed RNA polymerase specialized sigma24 family protein
MSTENTVAEWVRQLRDGDRRVAEQLWNAYYRRLTFFARKKLAGRVHLPQDEEDLALSALKSFCRGIERGRFQQIDNHDDLWNLLITITLHKVYRLVRDETRAKRGGNWFRVEASTDPETSGPISNLVASDASPVFAAEVSEEFDRLLQMLPNEEYMELVILKLEGHTNQEIAANWNKAERTVERKLNLIRQIWGQEIGTKG